MNIDMSACNQKTTKVVLRTNSKPLPYTKKGHHQPERGTINQNWGGNTPYPPGRAGRCFLGETGINVVVKTKISYILERVFN